MSKVEALLSSSDLLDRRSLLKTAGISGAGIFLGGALAGCGGSGGAAGGSVRGIAEADVLNFALNLEYLEAEFYLRKVNAGNGLNPGDRGSNPGTVTNTPVTAIGDSTLLAYAQEIATDEQAHVQFLRSALGSSAVDEPTIDFTAGFNAVGTALGRAFDPFANDNDFILASFLFEDVGVTAYRGAAPLLHGNNLSAAAGILGTEAYHASLIRTVINARGGSLVTESAGISDFRDNVDGSSDDDQPVNSGGQGPGTVNIVPTDSNGLVFARTPRNVANIVFESQGQASGGFFPNGIVINPKLLLL